MIKVERIKRFFSLLLILVILLVPGKALALTSEVTDVKMGINSLINKEPAFSFANVYYNERFTASGSSYFGLSGLMYNKSANDVSVVVKVTYYNKDKVEIANSTLTSLVKAGETNSYSQMAGVDIIKASYSINDISYFKLDANIKENGTLNMNYDYVINNYNIDMVVNDNNTFDITETIDVNFNTAKHGIYRRIPLLNTVRRLDGSVSKNKAKLSNVKVNSHYRLSKFDGNYEIRIGSQDQMVTGPKQYVLSYNYNIGKDPLKDKDELYFNLIGDNWDTTISNITFTVKMPKEFDSRKLGFSSGAFGSVDSSKIKYQVDGNIIKGSYSGTLNPKEALTLRLELNEGYFKNAKSTIGGHYYFMLGLPLIFLAIALAIWHRHGKDLQVVETVEFYPPEGFNSLEIAFLYNGYAMDSDVTSLLIYLADKGYIKITESDKKSLFKKEGFVITKLKDYDGNNYYEQLFLEGLFKNARDDVVNSYELEDSFYKTTDKILDSINDKENKDKIIEKKKKSKSPLIVFLAICAFLLITVPPVLEGPTPEIVIVAIVFPGLGLLITVAGLVNKSQDVIYINGKLTKSRGAYKGFLLIWGLLFGGIPWGFTMIPVFLAEPAYIISYVVGILAIIGMVLCIKFMPRRTKYGAEILGKIKGFKRFLETAEKEKLEALVMQNPSYFYDILPYVYVLGVSDKWISKFETINMKPPIWYEGSAYDIAYITTFISTTLISANTIMNYNSSRYTSNSYSGGSSSSSSGSSGGGSSGGGSGGGGGGSW